MFLIWLDSFIACNTHESGDSLVQSAQSCGCSIPGGVKGRAGQGWEHPEQCPWQGWNNMVFVLPSNPKLWDLLSQTTL